jgi:hypothetical protein
MPEAKFRWSEVDRDTKKLLDDLLEGIRRDLADDPLGLRGVEPNGAVVDPDAAVLRGFAAHFRRLAAERYPEDAWDRQQFEIRARETADGWIESAFDIYRDAIVRLGYDSSNYGAQIWINGLSGFLKHRISPMLEDVFGVTSEDRKWLKVSPHGGSQGATKARLKIGAVRRIVEMLEAEWGTKVCPGYTNLLIEGTQAMSRYSAIERAAAQVVSGSVAVPPIPSPDGPVPAQGLQQVSEPNAAEEPAAGSLSEPELTPAKSEFVGADADKIDPVQESAASWQTIKISFLSDHRVQIHNRAGIETLNYTEFGFADARDGKPNQAWGTLRVLAQARGIIPNTAKTGGEWSGVEKRIQEIRVVLRRHFRISSDPIPYVKGTGYQALFIIGCSPSFNT